MKYGPARAFCRKEQTAFTLVELAVVVGVIVVVFALLIPTGAKVLERARLTGCLAVLRQLAVPANAYQVDHHGFLPPRGASTSPFKSYLQYFRPYLAEEELFLCPKARRLPPRPAALGSATRPWYFSDTDYGTYALNYALCAERASFMFRQPLTGLHDFAPRAEIPMFIDAAWPGFSAETSEWNGNRVPFERHKGASVLFVDGSIRFYADQEVRTLKWNRNYIASP